MDEAQKILELIENVNPEDKDVLDEIERKTKECSH